MASEWHLGQSIARRQDLLSVSHMDGGEPMYLGRIQVPSHAP